ncbi:MAG: trehalose-phosphatase, partial [Candidatus Omnitrophica bacterium]|nr:trehalose-phosphatase [Candidatus Omnitrophota bacterium]
VENKGLTLSVHYRLVQTGQVNKVKNIFHSTLRSFVRRKRVRVTSGKKVLEVRPRVELDKGKAILLMLGKLPFVRPGVLPIYVGDDKTDESAFRVVNKKKGISIFVGGLNRRSSAEYYLKSTREVNTFLERMKRSCLIIAIITAAGISGCVGTKGGAVGTLLEVGRSEKYKQEALKQETTSFNRVKKYILENTIKKGISKKAAINKFGRPVLMTPKEGYEKWAYKPGDSDWFGGEKIYLFFDKDDKLISWKVVNAE